MAESIEITTSSSAVVSDTSKEVISDVKPPQPSGSIDFSWGVSLGSPLTYTIGATTYTPSINQDATTSTDPSYYYTDIAGPTTFTATTNLPFPVSHFTWEFGDGVIGVGSPFTHQYNRESNFLSVTLRVIDARGNQTSKTKSIYLKSIFVPFPSAVLYPSTTLYPNF